MQRVAARRPEWTPLDPWRHLPVVYRMDLTTSPLNDAGKARRQLDLNEQGNLETLGSCHAFADSPGCQDSRFSVPRPGGDLGAGATGGGGARCGRRPGELETWNSGIRAARRGAGRRGPAVARSARVGALGRRPWPPPWPGGARPSRAQGCDFRGSPRGCSRKRPPHRVGAVPQERVQSTEHTRSPRRTPENRIRARGRLIQCC